MKDEFLKAIHYGFWLGLIITITAIGGGILSIELNPDQEVNWDRFFELNTYILMGGMQLFAWGTAIIGLITISVIQIKHQQENARKNKKE